MVWNPSVPRPRQRPPSPGQLFALCLGLGLLAGCGAPERGPAPLDDAARHRQLQELAASEEAATLDDLFRIALRDPNHFLRARALEAIHARRPEGLMPTGALRELERMAAEDPDLTRRFAASVLLHFRGARAVATAAEVWATSTSERTRRTVAVAVAEALPGPELAELLGHRSDAVRGLAREAAAVAAARDRSRLDAYRERRRTGDLAARIPRTLDGSPDAR